MPTVTVDKEDLYERLGRTYTTEEFDEVCFDFGIELDEDTTEEVETAAAKGLPTVRPQLKIDIPANRYDLLCIEGISRALRIFLGLSKPPQYRLVPPMGSDLLTITVAPETAGVRPLFAGAILRNIHFNPRSYDSFIELQDKLHQNICRRRQLVSIGTHDLDTIEAPFRYEARRPQDIRFAPLNRDDEFRGDELMQLYESDRHLSKYLPIIRNSDVYPIIYDKHDQVLSLPPIINSQHSKITLNTRNVFIDVTATDETKLSIVVNMVSLMFSEYCDEPFTVEPVRVVNADGTEKITPNIAPVRMQARASYVNACAGLSLTSEKIVDLLIRMSLQAEVSKENSNILVVDIPPTRPDIIHECDIMEDATIAYGFNKLTPSFPNTHTIASPLPSSKVTDILRCEWAQAGWTEVLPLILCSHDENFAWMNRKDQGEAVRIANPKTLEFQIVRTSLIPGLLKTIRENRSHTLPLKVFEASDVAVKDLVLERQSRNIKHAAAVWCNKTAGFEMVHGLLDRIMKMLEVPFIVRADSKEKHGYYIKECQDPAFFPGRAAHIFYRNPPNADRKSTQSPKSVKDLQIGVLGILHPSVLGNFEITFPCSALEFSLEPFI